MKPSNFHFGRRTVVLIVCSLPFALSGVAALNRSAQEDEIQEAVFRHQFDHNSSGLQKTAHIYCLALGERNADPTDQFMRRFAHNTPSVRKASACRIAAASQVIDKRTGKPALLFLIRNMTWVSDTEAKVDGGYDEGNVSNSRNTYTVRMHGGKWVVTDSGIETISRVLARALRP